MCRPMALSSPHVCRQLQLCLPGVRVFLDVDDLKDISALESSIEQSAVVLIFLSKNYFGSRNWCDSHRNQLASDRIQLVSHRIHEVRTGHSIRNVTRTSVLWVRP